MNFTNKVVFIIGGGSGIGLATVNEYLQADAKVYVFDKNVSQLEKMTQHAQTLMYYEGDVRNQADLAKAVNEIEAKWQGIDIFVYCAGIFPDKQVLNMQEDEWDAVLDINVKGAFLASQLVAKSMINHNKQGHIITISSGSYRSARVGSAHYCASKAALVMFTKTLALELAEHNIFVNSLAPGLIQHPNLDEQYKALFKRKIPLGRIGDPVDIAKSVLMLTSPLNTYMTGQVVQVDGGISAGQYDVPFSNKLQ